MCLNLSPPTTWFRLAGGLAEMVEELNSGKIMYAYCRVKDPNAGLSKYVLVNWSGEGVNDMHKGLCANHLTAIACFFKGAHVTINARTDDDVEPDLILQKVAKASGVTYSIPKENLEVVDDSPQKPVGSVYQKTNAALEIKKINKDNFWAMTEKEEKRRKEQERQKIREERAKLEQEWCEREQKEATEREKRFHEKAKEIDEIKQYQEKADAEDRSKEKQRWEEVEQEYQNRMQRGFKKSESVEKAAEAATLVQKRTVNPREIFKQKERAVSFDETASLTPLSPAKTLPDDFRTSSPPSQNVDFQPAQGQTHLTSMTQASEPEYPPAQPQPQSAAAGKGTNVLQKVQSLQKEHEDDVTKDHKWDDNKLPSPAQHTKEIAPQSDFHIPANIIQEGKKDDAMEPYYEELAFEEGNRYEPEELPFTLEGKGLCARALYDYQAADETEITFDPDDIIMHVELIDEGWWRGYGSDGSYGLFPANYVELLN
uniref:Drebrin like n=1 Tax=Eptatretus burgeri TaxID=7764 RepID=A0A8C4R9N3_EPTBU